MRRALLVLWAVATVALTSSAAWATSEVWLPNGNAPDPLTSVPQKRRPVLFVHGHNADDASEGRHAGSLHGELEAREQA